MVVIILEILQVLVDLVVENKMLLIPQELELKLVLQEFILSLFLMQMQILKQMNGIFTCMIYKLLLNYS